MQPKIQEIKYTAQEVKSVEASNIKKLDELNVNVAKPNPGLVNQKSVKEDLKVKK